MTATINRESKYCIGQFFLCEKIAEALSARSSGGERADGSAAKAGLASQVAGAVLGGLACTAISHPDDVIKTRMQTQTPTSLTRYTSVLHGLLEVTRHEGLWALYRGTTARALNSGLSSGLIMGMYGVMRASLTKRLGIGPAERPKGPMAAEVGRRGTGR